MTAPALLDRAAVREHYGHLTPEQRRACWWLRRGRFVRIGGSVTDVTQDEWDALCTARGVSQVVYFIEALDSGLIKIGVSNDPWGRLEQFGHRFRLLALESGGRHREHYLHRTFGDLRAALEENQIERWLHPTEWFHPGEALMDYIGPEPA